jgi:hypothetical protein
VRLDRALDLDRYRLRMPHFHFDGHNIVLVSGGRPYAASIRTWLVEQADRLDWEILSPRIGRIVAGYGSALFRVKVCDANHKRYTAICDSWSTAPV